MAQEQAGQGHSEGVQDWLRLIRAEGVGPTLFGRLLERFGSPGAALEASMHDLMKVSGVGRKTAERIFATRGGFDADGELAKAGRLGATILHMEDPRYPAALRAIYDPPPVLYVKGELLRRDALGLAIVGSRRCSLYGQEQAQRFAHMLASAGFTIVSGMARGIDTAAHRGALSAGGRTIAVQGCGLGHVFPPENAKLAEMIARSGALVSELPVDYEPLAENFPGRNRIIAGLSLAVLVIEASARSGALITASAALEHNREVMAVPGKIDSPFNTGSHRLIKQGARLVDSVEDITEALGTVGKGLQEHTAESAREAASRVELPLFDSANLTLSDDERAVYDRLDGEPAGLDQIIAETSLPAGKVHASLISLRLKGLIRQLPGNTFIKPS